VAASADVYRFDPANGQVSTFAHLTHPLTHAAAATLNGIVFVIGGREDTPNSQTREILAISPNGVVSNAGTLPRPLSDVSAVALGGHILLAGGRDAAGHVDGAILTLSPR
jgi:N-acetylneuraminic acid mutarotase